MFLHLAENQAHGRLKKEELLQGMVLCLGKMAYQLENTEAHIMQSKKLGYANHIYPIVLTANEKVLEVICGDIQTIGTEVKFLHSL